MAPTSTWIIGLIVVAVIAYLMYRRRRPLLDYTGARLAFVLSPTCTYCKMSHPAWLHVKERHRDLDSRILVRGEDDTEIEKLGIEAYPTFILWRDGKEVSRAMGAKQPAELDTWVTQALQRSAPKPTTVAPPVPKQAAAVDAKEPSCADPNPNAASALKPVQGARTAAKKIKHGSMGNNASTSSTTYLNTMDFINSSITKNVMTVNNSCQQRASAEQLLSIKGDPDTNALVQRTMEACIVAGVNPQKCMPTYRIDGATIDSKAYPTQNCDLQNDQRLALKEKVANDVAEKMSSTTDALGETLRSALSSLSGKKEVKDIRNTTQFQNLMEDVTSTTTTNSVLQAVNASSRLDITGVLGNVDLKNIRLEAEVKALETSLNSSSVGKEFVKDVSSTTTQDITQHEVGLFETVQNLFNNVGSAIKGLTTMGMVYIAISAICVLGALYCVYKVLLSPAGQKAIEKGVNKGLNMMEKAAASGGGGGGLPGGMGGLPGGLPL